ncbi:hypothetical protein R5R35_005735 [Gryllus longicercus]|uniref:Chemosensory protein n=1 Tax=Gryllus longicercus TaxID=2509291 RepID=A0AAN9WU78_9ORTH
MNRLATALLAVALVALTELVVDARPQDTYSDRYDHVDIGVILQNKRLLDGYLRCFLGADDAQCDQMAKEVKAVLPEALPSNCARCTPGQTDAMRQVVRHLAKERPADWRQIQAKHDPAGAYAKANPDLFQ